MQWATNLCEAKINYVDVNCSHSSPIFFLIVLQTEPVAFSANMIKEEGKYQKKKKNEGNECSNAGQGIQSTHT